MSPITGEKESAILTIPGIRKDCRPSALVPDLNALVAGPRASRLSGSVTTSNANPTTFLAIGFSTPAFSKAVAKLRSTLSSSVPKRPVLIPLASPSPTSLPSSAASIAPITPPDTADAGLLNTSNAPPKNEPPPCLRAPIIGNSSMPSPIRSSILGLPTFAALFCSACSYFSVNA